MTVKTWTVALLCGMALALPVAAQETPAPQETPPAEEKVETPEPEPAKKSLEDPPLHRWGGWTLAVVGWNPTLIGADEEYATVYSGGVGKPVVIGAESNFEESIRLAYHLPDDIGSIVGQYDGMSSEEYVENFTPAEFQFAETRAYPQYLGAFDDGLADGVYAGATSSTREFRLGFQKRAFESKWARATWEIGYREVDHNRQFGAVYYAIVPNLPPAIPPVVGGNVDPLRLAPIPDVVYQSAGYSGNGIGASFDVEFTVHPRVSIISGISVGLIRGTASSTYNSMSSYYYLASAPDVPLTRDELFALLSNPPPPSDDPDNPSPEISDIDQQTVSVGLKSASSAQVGQSLDLYLGVQALVYKGLRVFATLRSVSYTNIGEYIAPRPGPSNERTSLNAGYEGVGVGLSWRY